MRKQEVYEAWKSNTITAYYRVEGGHTQKVIDEYTAAAQAQIDFIKKLVADTFGPELESFVRCDGNAAIRAADYPRRPLPKGWVVDRKNHPEQMITVSQNSEAGLKLWRPLERLKRNIKDGFQLGRELFPATHLDPIGFYVYPGWIKVGEGFYMTITECPNRPHATPDGAVRITKEEYDAAVNRGEA